MPYDKLVDAILDGGIGYGEIFQLIRLAFNVYNKLIGISDDAGTKAVSHFYKIPLFLFHLA